MFDVLPDAAVPPNADLSEQLKTAKNDCHKIFKDLPYSLERNSVLSALGRVGSVTLKHKVRHRALLLIGKAENLFSDLFTVTDEAVNCRNHYVHGSSSHIDYSTETDVFIFLTDTLEFVFAASDLIEAGWDIKTWRKNGTTMSHPFGRYCVTYEAQLQNLKSLLPTDAVKS